MRATTLHNLNVKNIREAVTKPPHTRSLSGPQLLAFLHNPLLVNLPVSSVAVERGVKDVTEAAIVCSDSMVRDSVILQKVAARQPVPSIQGQEQDLGREQEEGLGREEIKLKCDGY